MRAADGPKLTYESLLSHIQHHNLRKWLLDGCEREDANTIRAAVKRLSDGQLARRFARLLAKACVLLLLIALAGPALAGELPDPALTPGVTRTDLPEAAICTTKWGLDHRAVTPEMKKEVLDRYQMTPADCPSGKIEIDHKRPREMLGADVVENLWPQCYEKKVPGLTPSQTPEWGAHKKDRLENRIHREYCAGKITLDDANAAFDDWIAAYHLVFRSDRPQ